MFACALRCALNGTGNLRNWHAFVSVSAGSFKVQTLIMYHMIVDLHTSAEFDDASLSIWLTLIGWDLLKSSLFSKHNRHGGASTKGSRHPHYAGNFFGSVWKKESEGLERQITYAHSRHLLCSINAQFKRSALPNNLLRLLCYELAVAQWQRREWLLLRTIHKYPEDPIYGP